MFVKSEWVGSTNCTLCVHYTIIFELGKAVVLSSTGFFQIQRGRTQTNQIHRGMKKYDMTPSQQFILLNYKYLPCHATNTIIITYILPIPNLVVSKGLGSQKIKSKVYILIKAIYLIQFARYAWNFMAPHNSVQFFSKSMKMDSTSHWSAYVYKKMVLLKAKKKVLNRT